MINVNVKVIGKAEIDPNELLTVKKQNLKKADFSRRKLKDFCSINSHFEDCNFENMRVDCFRTGSGLELSEYINCSFDGSRFKKVMAGYARFINCTFRNTVIKDMFSFQADFINCIFSGKMKGVVINGSVPKEMRLAFGKEKNEIYGNDFSGVEMDDVGFRTGVDLSQQKLPESDDYLYLPNSAIILNQAKEIIINEWPDSGMKEWALAQIQGAQDDVARGQNQILFNRNDTVLGLFDLLKELSEK
jgi:uncharacterized protein YjbI with pentapeptide repeats